MKQIKGETRTMRKRAMVLTLIGVLLSAVFAGCSQGGGKNAGGDPSAQNGGDADDAALTAHLTMYTDLSLSDEWFRKFVFDPVEKKFPGVKIDLVRRQQGSTPNDLVAAGSFPDILYNSTPRLTTYKDLGLLYDMRDLIKKYNFDTSRLNQAALDAIKQWGTGQGEIYGLPFWVNWTALFYNKDIFDKFAVPYPKDGMTWEEAIELSRRLNRTEGGVNYRGLDIHDMNSFYSQLSLPYVDAKTDTALLETDGFKKVYETLLSLVKIPGNENRPSAKDAFLKDKNLAMWPMYADVPTWINDLIASGEKFNWDLAQMPSFKERPNVA
jgi:multiple sugar transport system substrate-binding protein